MAVRAWNARNREKLREKERRRYARNPQRSLGSKLKRYGMTLQQFQAMSAAQEGKCAICRRMDSAGRRLAVDHDHQSGKVRGLLCGLCNPGIGYFGNDPSLLLQAAVYLLALGGKDAPQP